MTSPQPHWDRLTLSWRERAAWRRTVRRFGWEVRRQLLIAEAEELIEHARRRIRQCLGEGGDA